MKKSIDDFDKICPKCGKIKNALKGPDPCLGYLPGVIFACCGHGRKISAYVVMDDGKKFRGQIAIDLMDSLKKKAKRFDDVECRNNEILKLNKFIERHK